MLGSYGMGPALTFEERQRVTEAAIAVINRHVPVIIHVGTADTATSLKLAEHAASLGCDALAIVPPLLL